MLYENDVLVPDGLYVINSYGTGKVFTQVESDIYLQKYEQGSRKQIFKATEDANKRSGLVCLDSNDRVGRNRFENLKCNAALSDQGSWDSEALHFWRAPEGGYKILMTKDDRFCPLKITSDSGGEYLMMVATTEDAWGLTKVGQGDRVILPADIVHHDL